MRNLNENEFEIQSLSVTIEKASRCLHNSIMYIYAISVSDFYNINVKDLFKISLSDISNPNILSNLGIAPMMDLPDFKSDSFNQLSDLFFFAFAVRLPFLMRAPQLSEFKIKPRLYRDVFEDCISKGAADRDNIVKESFKSNLKLAKSTKTTHPEPSFNGEWLRRWVYFNGTELAELAAITNKNMFLLGCMDALIPLYYAELTDKLVQLIISE